jgi:hypothetical protein
MRKYNPTTNVYSRFSRAPYQSVYLLRTCVGTTQSLRFDHHTHSVPVASRAGLNRDDAEEILEPLAILLVVDDLGLNLLLAANSLAYTANDAMVGGCLLEAIRPAAAGRLEKAAILTESLGAGVPRKLTKGIRDIDDGHIRLLQVTKNEGYRTVDSPNFDLRIWPREDLQEYGHNVEASGRIESGIYDGVLDLLPCCRGRRRPIRPSSWKLILY